VLYTSAEHVEGQAVADHRCSQRPLRQDQLLVFFYKIFMAVLQTFNAVLRVRIHRIKTFFDLLDLDPDPSVRGMYPGTDQDPSITKQTKVRKTLIPTAL
jgi:hypothetical protein